MKIVNEKCLDTMRGPGVCEHCKKQVRVRQPHHVFTRGAGRIDAPFTCLALCDVFSGGDDCHAGSHQNIPRATFMALLAEKNNCLQSDIKGAVDLIRRADLPIPWSLEKWAEEMKSLTDHGKRLVQSVLPKRKRASA